MNLKDLYYNPETGFNSAGKFYKKVRKYGFTKKQVDNFLKNQTTYQMHYENKSKKEQYEKIMSRGINNNWQADLMDMSKVKTISGNKNYAWILVVVDVYSRYCFARPVKHKSSDEVKEAFDDIIEEAGAFPKNLNIDEGSEFRGNFRRFCKHNDIILWVSDPTYLKKNAIVERMNRTIRNYLKKIWTAEGNHNFINVLPQLIKNYNRTDHRTLKDTPFNVYKATHINKTQHMQKTHLEDKHLPIGALVRKVKKLDSFGKGDKPKYSQKTYKIDAVKGKSYILTDNEGNYAHRHYKRFELLPIHKAENLSKKDTEIKPALRQRTIKRRLKKSGLDINEDIEAIINRPRPKRKIKKRVILDL